MIICRCEEVTLDSIEKAIKDGARTISGVKLRTRCCMGFCQGRICQSLIERVLETTQTVSEEKQLIRQRVQNPVRPVALGQLTEDWKLSNLHTKGESEYDY